MKHVIQSTALSMVLLSGAVSCGGCLRHSESKSVVAEQASLPAVEPVEVEAVRVMAKPAKRMLNFVGTLYGDEEVTLSSQVEGQLRTVHADLGDRIEKGQVLAEIDDAQMRAKLREVEAQVAKTRTDEARGRELSANRVISAQEYDVMKTAAAVAAAQRDTLTVMLEHARVRSPLSGSVATRSVSAGEYVRAGTPLFRLVADQSLKLRGEVPERFAKDLAVGQTVEITVDAYQDTVFTGEVSRISPSVNRDTRSIAVEASLANDGRLKPGFFANASVVTRTDDQALLVPHSAILTFAGVTKVFVVRDGLAHQTPVRLGKRGSSEMVEILEGLYSDEIVVTNGAAKIENGAPVKITRMGEPELNTGALPPPPATGPS